MNAAHLAQQTPRRALVRPWIVVHSQVPLVLALASAEIRRGCAWLGIPGLEFWLGILSSAFLGPVSGWGALGVGVDANFIQECTNDTWICYAD